MVRCYYFLRGLELQWLLIGCIILQLGHTEEAEMVSQCAVKGMQVTFQCSDASWWYVNDELIHTAVDQLTVEASIDYENMTSGDFENVTSGGFQITDIFCVSGGEYYDAYLIVVDDSDPQIPLDVIVDPVDKTSLLLKWEQLPILNSITYTVVISTGEEHEIVELTESSLLLDLEGKECQPFQVTISMPGFCANVTVTGSLLVEPPYPMAENVTATVMENKTVILTWQHPVNIFEEADFTYNITVTSLTTSYAIERLITMDSLQSPWEEFDFAELNFCEQLEFTLSQPGDCREQHITTLLPIFPGEFVSELEVEKFFTEIGDIGLVELQFQPPDLCDYQMETASYMFKVSDGISSWSTGPESLSHRVIISDRNHFIRDRQYMATATIITQYGNASSHLNFSTTSHLGEARLEEGTILFEIETDSSIHIMWSNPTNTLRESFTYIVIATLVETGETVEQQTIVVTKDNAPSSVFGLSQYICEQVNVTIEIFNSLETIFKVITPPAYPLTFQQNTTANTFMVNGKIKELEVSFTPPQLCDFQMSSYIISFTDGNETWSRAPVVISDTSQPVKEDIESGFVLNRNYTITVTVITEHGNITSSANFSFLQQPTAVRTERAEGESTGTGLTSEEVAAITGGVGVGVVSMLVCAVVVVIIVYYFNLKKNQADMLSQNKFRPTVTNPIYETGESDVYEELPDINSNDATCTNVAPPLPSVRYNHLLAKSDALKNECVDTQTPKHCVNNKLLMIPSSQSTGALSELSGEDCYTVMNPAGTITMMPRHSGTHTVGGGGPCLLSKDNTL